MLKQIVQFPDGQYAYRKLTLSGYRYLDLRYRGISWWGRKSEWFKDCITTDLDWLQHYIKEVNSYGDPI